MISSQFVIFLLFCFLSFWIFSPFSTFVKQIGLTVGLKHTVSAEKQLTLSRVSDPAKTFARVLQDLTHGVKCGHMIRGGPFNPSVCV